MTTEDKLGVARASLVKLNGDKDKYLATYKGKARALRDKFDGLAAELVAERVVGDMSDAEQQAVQAQLTKLGGGS